jgi:hypothetical protein
MVRRTWVVGVVALLVAAGCGLGGKDDGDAAAAPAPSAVVTEPTFEPVTESPTPEPVETTTKPPATKKPVSKPKTTEPTAPPFWSELPACAHYDKTKPVSKTKVKTALKSAATRVYWRTEAPDLRINYPLIKAIAWQESGWQSNIHNCDGGAGVMQVMPATVDMINGRFGLSYDSAKFTDNVLVGGNYLAWMTKWVGDTYFKSAGYNLSSSKCKSATSWCLLNVVISGYNAGQGGIEAAAESKTLPNPEYVAAVRALMKRCQCDQY